MGSELADLLEGAAEDGEDGAVFVAVDFFFEFDELFQAEDANGKSSANFQLVGVSEEIFVGKVLANCTEEVEVAVGSSQIEVAAPGEMAFVGAQAAVRLDTKDGFNLVQYGQKASDVFGASLVNDVQIESGNWYPARYCRQSTHKYEIDLGLREQLNGPKELRRHWPRSRSRGLTPKCSHIAKMSETCASL